MKVPANQHGHAGTTAFAYKVCAAKGGDVFPVNETITNQNATIVMVPSATAVEPFTGGTGRLGPWAMALAPLVVATGMFL